MKTRALLSLASGLLCLSGFALADPPTQGAPRQRRPRWNVRVEVLMVAMPQERLLKLLPDLRNANKSEAAVGELMAAVQRKEAILMGNPIVHTVDGRKGISETIDEKRFPTGYEWPPKAPAKESTPSQNVDAGLTEESAFDTRNFGATLEAEPHVSRGGESILVDIVPQRVALTGYETYKAAKAANGEVMKVDQPQFFDAKVQTTVSVPNGQHLLVGMHVLTRPEGYVEVFVVSATATPIK